MTRYTNNTVNSIHADQKLHMKVAAGCAR